MERDKSGLDSEKWGEAMKDAEEKAVESVNPQEKYALWISVEFVKEGKDTYRKYNYQITSTDSVSGIEGTLYDSDGAFNNVGELIRHVERKINLNTTNLLKERSKINWAKWDAWQDYIENTPEDVYTSKIFVKTFMKEEKRKVFIFKEALNNIQIRFQYST